MTEKPFWREAPFNEAESQLWNALMRAHHRSVFRPNVSSEIVQMAAAGSGDYLQALSAGILSLGGRHAPIRHTLALLSMEDPAMAARAMLGENLLVPGWGTSFKQSGKDEIWDEVEGLLTKHYPELMGKISAVTETLHAAGKNILPNPSAFTAACALALGVPAGVAPMLLVMGRTAGWTELICRML